MSVREVLIHLGFHEDWTVQWTDDPPGYKFDFGNLELSASKLTDSHFRPAFVFSGVMNDGRTIASIGFDLPLEVETLEQGIALVADRLKRYRFNLRLTPAWLEQGLSLEHHLPRVRRATAYSQRPVCLVEKAWLEVVRRKLRALPSLDGQGWLRFDGEFLRLVSDGLSLAVAAEGAAWPYSITFELSRLATAMKRMSGSTIQLGVWEGHLAIGSSRLPVVTETDSMRGGSLQTR